MSNYGLYKLEQGSAGCRLGIFPSLMKPKLAILFSIAYFIAFLYLTSLVGSIIFFGCVLFIAIFLWTKLPEMLSVRRKKRPAIPNDECFYNYFHVSYTEDALIHPERYGGVAGKAGVGVNSINRSM